MDYETETEWPPDIAETNRDIAERHWNESPRKACDCEICVREFRSEFKTCADCELPTIWTQDGHGGTDLGDDFLCCACDAHCECRDYGKKEWRAARLATIKAQREQAAADEVSRQLKATLRDIASPLNFAPKCERYVCPYCGRDVEEEDRNCARCRENHGVPCGTDGMRCEQCEEVAS